MAVERLEVKALTQRVSSDLPDLMLCPVRAVERYLVEAAKRRKPGNDRLFISLQENRSKSITAATVSRWIVETVKLAYSLTEKDNMLIIMANVTAHVP